MTRVRSYGKRFLPAGPGGPVARTGTAFTVKCPTCNAPIGRPCLRLRPKALAGGHLTHAHTARRNLALKKES